eukprot:scaffold153951_cov26-Tisochrysis_lutea.AAC.1
MRGRNRGSNTHWPPYLQHGASAHRRQQQGREASWGGQLRPPSGARRCPSHLNAWCPKCEVCWLLPPLSSRGATRVLRRRLRNLQALPTRCYASC